MKYHLHLFGTGIACLCALLASCEQKGPKMKLRAEIVNALENVEDKASADEAAQVINEALLEYKKDHIDMEQKEKRFKELKKQISEKEYYNSEALKMVL